MKKTKKVLASLAIASMVMTTVPFNAFADNGITTARLSGTDRIGTAVQVANDGWKTADTAILAPSADANLVDALAAAPLAGKNAPILLTDNNTLSDTTKLELTNLGVKNVYVVGAISQSVVNQVNAMKGVTATVLKGSDRIATAAAISAKLTAPAGSFVVGYGALADALSVASYAAANNYSILVANPDGSLPASEAAYKGAKVYIVGGPTLVADIPGATRLYGSDRFATNQKVLSSLSYQYDKAYVANGTDAHLVDSLVASSLAAKTNAPIVLGDTASAAAAADVHSKLASNAVVTALGGTTVVPDAVLNSVANGKGTTPVVVPPVTMGAISVAGQTVGTGAKASPAVATVNTGITVSTTVSGQSAANASITYLVTTSNNITAKDSAGNTLVDTTLNSPVIIGNDTFNASYTVPADANGNVKATFSSTASSQESFNVVIEAPFSNNGQPVKTDVASIEWGTPGTTVLSPVYTASNPDSLNFSTSSTPNKGLVPVVATILPAVGSTTPVSGQNIKFTMSNGGRSTGTSNAFFTDASGTAMLASGAVVGKGGSDQVTYVVPTDDKGQALVYINSNLPTNNSVADLGAIMNVGVQAQLVNGGGSSTTGYYEWKAVSQPSKVANVTPSAMLNATGLEGGGTVASNSAETATSGSTLTIGGTVQDAAGNPVKGVSIAIQDYDVTGGASSNNVQNDAFIASDGTTKLFSAVDYPTVTTDSNGNWSVKVTANVPVTQSIQNSITRYYAYYVPPTIAISAGQSLPTTVTSLTFVGNSNSGNFIDLVWQQGQTAQTIGVSHTSLLPNYTSLSDVPQTMKFSNVVGYNEEMYAAAYNQTGTIIAPASGNQFDGYALNYDLTAPVGIYFNKLGSVDVPVDATHGGVTHFKATYNQYTGFKITQMYYSDGTLATETTALPYATAFASAYDGSGQLHFYLESDKTSSVITSGTAGSVNVNISAYSNTSSSGVIDTNHAQGSASGTINAAFTASNSIASIGVTGDLTGINQYYPLLQGNAAPDSTLTVAGVALPAGNAYDSSKNASFVVAPFNSYPAIATIPSQGLTLNINADKNGKISRVDGYTLASMPTNVSVNVNSAGEVSVNNVKLWTANSGYKVVGYMPGAASGSVTLIEQSTTTPTTFGAFSVTSVGMGGSQIGTWSLPSTSLPGNFEGFLGFNVDASGGLQPIVASTGTLPSTAPTGATTIAAGSYSPVTVAQAFASDKYSEGVTITITNSLNSQKATVTTNFTASNGGLVAVKSNPSSVNSVVGGSQTITLTAQDAYGNAISNQTLYLGTGSDTAGLWLTQVNGSTITGSVNMGTTNSTSMQSVSTPIPLYSVATKPAYVSATGSGVTAYNINTTPVVALTTGVDGTVSITLVDGNVTYVANTATATSTNSYTVAVGQNITAKALPIYSDATVSKKVGSFVVNWSGAATVNVPVTGVTLNNTTLSLTNGATASLTATVAPTTATNQAVTWTSSNTAVATVSTSGVVTAVGAGAATITVTTADGAMTATCAVSVNAAGALITGQTATYDGFMSTLLKATVDPSVTSVKVVDTTKGLTIASALAPSSNSLNNSLIGVAKGDILTLTPSVGTTVGAAVQVTVN